MAIAPRILWRAWVVACVVCSAPGAARGAEPASATPTPTGEEILQRSAAVYAQATSYQDTGEVTTRFFPRNRDPHETVSTFSTAFTRPGRFRFEFRNRFDERQPDWNRYVIWQADAEVQAWWSLRPNEAPPENLALGLARAAGVSSGSSYRIPGQLQPDVINGRPFLARLRRVTLLGVERLDMIQAYKIQGRADTLEQTIWIGLEDFLIRKIYEEHTFERFETQTTTVYVPRVNQPVAPESLIFGVAAPAAQ